MDTLYPSAQATFSPIVLADGSVCETKEKLLRLGVLKRTLNLDER